MLSTKEDKIPTKYLEIKEVGVKEGNSFLKYHAERTGEFFHPVSKSADFYTLCLNGIILACLPMYIEESVLEEGIVLVTPICYAEEEYIEGGKNYVLEWLISNNSTFRVVS